MNTDFNNEDRQARLDALEKKWLDGSISNSEMEEYAQWYNANQNDKVNVPEDIATSYEQHEKLLLDNIITALHIKSSTKKESGKVISMLKKSWIYGSVGIVIVIACIFFIKNEFSKNGTSQVAIKNNIILPGTNGLQLFDQNGNTIDISKTNNGWTTLSNGVIFQKNTEQLVFGKNKLHNIYSTAVTKKGQQFRIILPDGTKIFLNAQSILKFPISMDDDKRVVELSGEAYFEVVHNEKQPFIVKVNGIEIKDIGTKFNIESYLDDSSSKVALIDGEIQVLDQNETISMQPNQEINWQDQNKLNLVKSIDTSYILSWTKKEFSFNNANIYSIAKKLERWYNIQVSVNSHVNKMITFSGETPMNQNLQEVLNVLSYSGIHFKLRGRELEILP